jgi:hypothetical protein
MALTGSDQHLTERHCGLNSEQIPRCGAVKKRVRAASRWLSTTAIAVCAIVTTRCSIWVITLIDELHNATRRTRRAVAVRCETTANTQTGNRGRSD